MMTKLQKAWVKKIGASLALVWAMAAHSVQARDLTFDEKASDLHQLVSVIKSGYGPLKYKAEVMKVNVDELRDRYLEKIRQTKSNSEFYYLINQFVAEFKDSHFGSAIPSTHRATLNFMTDLVDGKVLIDTINRNKLSEKDFPFARGDEIVEFDGKPIAQVLDELQTYGGSGFEQTQRRRAAMRIASRAGAALPVPSGSVTMKIRHGTSNIIETVTLTWEVSGTPLDESKLLSLVSAMKGSARDYDELSIRSMWEEFKGPKAERSYSCSGSTRIAMPKDATVIMEKPFVAYYFPTAKGNIGYLRIPHYFPQNEQTGEFEYELRFRQYEYAVSVLEKNTVGLIIDQDHNCGGSVDYLHRLMSLFMGTPFQPMQFQLLANKEEVLGYQSWMNQLDKSTLEYQGCANVFNLVKSSWEQGAFMTTKTAIDGIATVYPNAIRYTKPIVMTIDELSGSGGDAFPSLMQGYGRAKLVGTRTMGAGGHVVQTPPLNYSQITLNMTKSLFFRPDGVAVENNGAVPDYPYTITRDDFLYGYRDYFAFTLSKLQESL